MILLNGESLNPKDKYMATKLRSICQWVLAAHLTRPEIKGYSMPCPLQRVRVPVLHFNKDI